MAALAPIIIHLIHRRKATRVNWPGMRFLQEALVQRRKQIVIRDFLLLLVRVLIILLAAISLMRPVFRNSEGAAPRTGRTAAVILIDDSASTGSGRASKAIEELKRLANAYVDTLKKGGEVSVIRLSALDSPVPDPTFNLDEARSLLMNVQPTEADSDWQRMLEAGARQFSKHVNPGRELVIITDGWSEGWNVSATNVSPIILTLPPRKEKNMRISQINLDRMVVPVGRITGVEVTVEGNWEGPLRLQVMKEPAREVRADEKVTIPVTFLAAGTNLITAEITGGNDVFPYDDRRELAVEVIESLPVLLVETRNSLEYAAAALAPETNDLFEIRRVSISQLENEDLGSYKVLVIGDAPGLSSSASRKIEEFVSRGGGVLFAYGPNTAPSEANSESKVTAIDQTHPVMQQLGDNWRQISVRRSAPTRLTKESRALMTLSSGKPLLVEEKDRKVMHFGSTLDAQWTDLPLQPVYVPLVRGIVAYLGQTGSHTQLKFSDEGKFEYLTNYPFANFRRLTSAEQVREELSGKNAEGSELWRAFLFGSLFLLILETGMMRKKP